MRKYRNIYLRYAYAKPEGDEQIRISILIEGGIRGGYKDSLNLIQGPDAVLRAGKIRCSLDAGVSRPEVEVTFSYHPYLRPLQTVYGSMEERNTREEYANDMYLYEDWFREHVFKDDFLRKETITKEY